MEYIGIIENDKLLNSSRDIIIYGAGKVGQYIFGYLRDKSLDGKVRLYCDNNEKIQGFEKDGIPVVSVLEAVRMYPDATYLVASMCVKQMVESLMQYGIEKIHIIRESI